LTAPVVRAAVGDGAKLHGDPYVATEHRPSYGIRGSMADKDDGPGMSLMYDNTVGVAGVDIFWNSGKFGTLD